MATSGIVLKTIASVRVFFLSTIMIFISIPLLIIILKTSSWENNVPVIQVRFFQNAIQVLLV